MGVTLRGLTAGCLLAEPVCAAYSPAHDDSSAAGRTSENLVARVGPRHPRNGPIYDRIVTNPSAPQRIFVAGATGALGVPLVRKLVARGHAVTGLTRSAAKRGDLERLGARAVVADALAPESIGRAIADAKPDTVVHALTALPRGGPRKASDLDATNRLRGEGTRNLVRAAHAARARRFVAESIVFAYGWQDEGDALIDETRPRATRVPAMLKPAADALAALEDQTLGAGPGLEGIVLRYGLFYGAGSGSTEALAALLAKRKLPVFGRPDSAIPWIHVDDAAEATMLAIERGAPGGIYNVTDEVPTSFRDYALEVARVTRAPLPRAVPLWLVRLLLPYAAVSGSVRLRVTSAKAKRELAWQPKFPSVKEGLAGLGPPQLQLVVPAGK
jgi:nucleoside-diphosphate-sugar epimerase